MSKGAPTLRERAFVICLEVFVRVRLYSPGLCPATESRLFGNYTAGH
jgi:hypothetical protein